MALTFSAARRGSLALLALALTSLAATTGRGDTPPSNNAQVADLEKQLAELQAKLKALKEKGPDPKVVAATEIVPADWVKKFAWRSIGPATMGGRITGLAVFEADPTTYWVATASGGLLKTTNNGVTFEHQFDREATVSIGAVAVAPSNKDIVWVGTGEANPRNSVSWGDGVYKSVDGGKKWQNVGLKTSFQIGVIAIHPKNPDIVYVGALGRLYGPGGERGLFKTEDGGKTWKSVLPQCDDKTGVIDLIMHPTNPDTLIVATWERQRDEFDSFKGDAKAPEGADGYAPSKVHAPGSALYKTTDGGKTFTHLVQGLPNVHLGRVGLDYSRKNPNVVFAIIDTEKAGTGKPLASAYLGIQGEDVSTGGAKLTGVTADQPAAKSGLKEGDIIVAVDGMAVKDYEALVDEFRKRKPADKAKFTVLRGKDKVEIEVTFGLRPGVETDRPSIGVQADEAEGGMKITLVMENGPAAKAGLKVGDLITVLDETPILKRVELLRVLTAKKIGDKLKVSYTRGTEKKTAEVVLEAGGPVVPQRPFAGQLGGNRENAQKDQGPEGVQSGGVFKSIDGGDTWARVNSLNPRPFYFSVIRVDPTDENTIYVTGIKLYRSTDGGKKFSTEKINAGVHDDQHALWINPKDARHMLVGTDGGFYVSFDKAANWDHLNHAGALGQFYHVAVDSRKPYRVYGGLQDNGSWGGPSRSDRWPGPSSEDWGFVAGGDGFVCRVDPNDPDQVYAESQDGSLMRRNLRTGVVAGIRPQLKEGATPYRFNWNTPFLLSSHNSAIYYCAGNYVFRSLKRGDELQIVSPEITRTKRGSATALAESPRNPDVLWVGTDDGAVWVTKDAGKEWTNLAESFKAAGIPGPRWVSTIETSRWVDGRAYVVFDGHRSNDEAPYVFVTEDFGKTWKPLAALLPAGSARVLREDTVNPDLLYLGTEFACYASINRGEAWTRLSGPGGLPTVAVHEFAQPTTANDLVVATHGRSVWVLDVTPLRQMTADVVKGKTALFAPSPGVQWRQQPGGSPYSSSARKYFGQNPPSGAQIDYVLAKKAEKVSLKIVDVNGRTLRDLGASSDAGYHRVSWDFRITPPPAPKEPKDPKEPKAAPVVNLNPLARPRSNPNVAMAGTYRVVLTVDGTEFSQPLIVEGDPNAAPGATTEEDEVEEERRLMKKARALPELAGDD